MRLEPSCLYQSLMAVPEGQASVFCTRGRVKEAVSTVAPSPAVKVLANTWSPHTGASAAGVGVGVGSGVATAVGVGSALGVTVGSGSGPEQAASVSIRAPASRPDRIARRFITVSFSRGWVDPLPCLL